MLRSIQSYFTEVQGLHTLRNTRSFITNCPRFVFMCYVPSEHLLPKSKVGLRKSKVPLRQSNIMFGGSPRLCLAEVQDYVWRKSKIMFGGRPSEGSLADVQGFNLQLRKSTRLCLAEVLRLSPRFYLVQVERLYTGVQEFNMRKSKRHH